MTMDRQATRRAPGVAVKIALLTGTLVFMAVTFEVGLRAVGYQPRTATTLDTFSSSIRWPAGGDDRLFARGLQRMTLTAW